MTPAEKKRLQELLNAATNQTEVALQIGNGSPITGTLGEFAVLADEQALQFLEALTIADTLAAMQATLAEMQKAAAAIVENAKGGKRHAGR